ncbi:hypothetical protein SCHPADRAFT_621627 [Schizopora paradoxa]|uniref:Uncharacterized protein n=1 Tax=Schizopora paradoxa TaxID=27342 RepID=A0A0H2RTE6_9AGAM|nr:hypothetical protein SCHPADRAFT_621627 [Schizopora paradoxa]
MRRGLRRRHGMADREDVPIYFLLPIHHVNLSAPLAYSLLANLPLNPSSPSSRDAIGRHRNTMCPLSGTTPSFPHLRCRLERQPSFELASKIHGKQQASCAPELRSSTSIASSDSHLISASSLNSWPRIPNHRRSTSLSSYLKASRFNLPPEGKMHRSRRRMMLISSATRRSGLVLHLRRS